jgi:hypothetical protein
MGIDVGEKYPHCIAGFEVAEAFRPFDDDGGVGLIEDLIETESFQTTRLNPVQIDMVNANPPSVLVDQRERGTGNFAGVRNAESFGEPFAEQRFSGAQLAMKQNVSGQLEGAREFAGDLQGLFFRA